MLGYTAFPIRIGFDKLSRNILNLSSFKLGLPGIIIFWHVVLLGSFLIRATILLPISVVVGWTSHIQQKNRRLSSTHIRPPFWAINPFRPDQIKLPCQVSLHAWPANHPFLPVKGNLPASHAKMYPTASHKQIGRLAQEFIFSPLLFRFQFLALVSCLGTAEEKKRGPIKLPPNLPF